MSAVHGVCPVCHEETCFHLHITLKGERLRYCEKCNHTISERALNEWFRTWSARRKHVDVKAVTK